MHDESKQRISRLEKEEADIKARVQQARAQLAAAEAAHMRDRSGSTGAEVIRLRDKVGLDELALRGVVIDLERARAPKPVTITSSRYQLTKDREDITNRRAYRHREHAERVERERERVKGWPEGHITQHLANIFDAGHQTRANDDAFDQRRLDSIDAQLAELDRREQQPHDAA